MRMVVLTVAAAMAALAMPQTQALKDFGNRFEGVTGWNASTPDFELVSFTRRFDGFTTSSVLTVSFFHPPNASPNDSPEVLAQELVLNKGYIMRSKPQATWKPGQVSTFGRWPTADVLDSQSLDAGLIGVVVRIGEADRLPRYVPADVIASTNKKASTPEEYVLKLRRRGRLNRVRFLLLRGTGDARERVMAWEEQLDPKERDALGTGIVVTRRKAKDLPADDLELQVVGDVHNSTRPTQARLRIYNPKTW